MFLANVLNNDVVYHKVEVKRSELCKESDRALFKFSCNLNWPNPTGSWSWIWIEMSRRRIHKIKSQRNSINTCPASEHACFPSLNYAEKKKKTQKNPDDQLLPQRPQSGHYTKRPQKRSCEWWEKRQNRCRMSRLHVYYIYILTEHTEHTFNSRKVLYQM